jgi:L-lactate dehydrogenase (cytochrome)
MSTTVDTNPVSAAGAAGTSGRHQAVPRRLSSVLCLDDFEGLARRHLPRPIFGYVSGAAETNASLADNRAAFADFGFVPRALIDVSGRTTQTELFGIRYAAPFGIAPMGISAISAYRGDITLARAAASAGIPMIISGSSLIAMEDIRSEGSTTWFQAYLPGDADRIAQLVRRVERAEFSTLVLTVDTPVQANRENNVRAGFSTPLRPSPRLAIDGLMRPNWLFSTLARTLLKHGMPHFENSFAERGAPIFSRNVMRDFSAKDHLSWQHLELIRRLWKGNLVVKGIMSHKDAAIARECGADGVIISNHGGRQLDGAVSPLRVLEAVVEEVGKSMPVMVDGGIRRGTDVIKAIALGARFVFVGRPFLYAAAVAGESGVNHAIRLLAEETKRDMGLLGVTSIEAVGPDQILRIKR